MRRSLVLGSRRELGTVGLVAGLCGAYAGVLVTTSSLLAALSDGGGAAGILLGVVATVFILIAVYVSAVVIVNAVDTVVAGRLRQVALLRLLGARARTLRGSVMRASGAVGTVGSAAGALLGVAATDGFRVVLVARGTLPTADYPVTSVYVLAPVAVVGVTALLAGWVGSRAVLRVSPAQALSTAEAAAPSSARVRSWRVVVSLVLVGGGALTLVAAAVVAEGAASPGSSWPSSGPRRPGRGCSSGRGWSSRGSSSPRAWCSVGRRPAGSRAATPSRTGCAPPGPRWAWSSASRS